MTTIKKYIRLNQFFATAICGNDILSSSLYVSGIAIIFAGVYAPLILLFIGLVLFFYKSVYTEVVEALPINGGAYNCLLNSTSKTIAGVAGITTVLSYVATAVISGNTAINYLHTVLTNIPIIPSTIILLLFFAFLVIAGIKDSAKIALIIFLFHIIMLTAFVMFGILHLGTNITQFKANFSMNHIQINQNGGLLFALFFAFSSSLLGVSGFESSANFVEEQDRGVFRKTLRNMLIGVTIFNPLIAVAILGAMPFSSIAASKNFLLSDAAHILGGNIFQFVIVIDAFLVLAGAVLTAYVGVGGLLFRMASDGCLPNFLTHQNKNGSYPRIVILFFLLCTSILILTHGDLFAMAGVYTIAFLSVMTLFAFGNLILRQTRTELKRTYSAPWLFVILALLSTAIGVMGNIIIDSRNLINFSLYFIPSLIIILSMIYLDTFLNVLLKTTKHIPIFNNFIHKYFQDITSGTIIAFINHKDRLHNTLSYINRNETARNIILIHCKNWDNKHDLDRYREIKELIEPLQEAGAYPHFSIKFVYKDIPFGPDAIQQVSKEYKVRQNRIMIGSIHDFHQFDYAELGGVRIIF